MLFDLDGTLVRAGGAGRRALDRAVFDLHGVAEVCSTFSLAGRTDLDNFRLALKRALRRAPTKAEAAALAKAYLERLPAEVRRAVRDGRYELVPGIGRLLKALARRRGVLVGLGTGNIERGARLKLEPSGLLPHFSFGGYGCDAYTRVSLLRRAVRRASALAGAALLPADVFVIGDTHKDVAAGKAAGYHTGAVLCGFGERRKIDKAGPELVAEDFRDPRPWLDWILGAPTRKTRPRPVARGLDPGGRRCYTKGAGRSSGGGTLRSNLAPASAGPKAGSTLGLTPRVFLWNRCCSRRR